MFSVFASDYANVWMYATQKCINLFSRFNFQNLFQLLLKKTNF